jgi:hypothetical protein
MSFDEDLYPTWGNKCERSELDATILGLLNALGGVRFVVAYESPTTLHLWARCTVVEEMRDAIAKSTLAALELGKVERFGKYYTMAVVSIKTGVG